MNKLIVCMLIVMTSIVLAVGTIVIVEAGPGGRSLSRGYFTNTGPKTTGFSRVLEGGVPYTTSKASFINRVKSQLTDGDQQNRTGAAFIIQLMRGAPYDHGRPSASDIADWEARINSNAVSIQLRNNYSFSLNSGYMGKYGSHRANDDAFYNEGGRHDSLVFIVDGEERFAVKEDCANPVGDFDGLPPPDDGDPKPEPPSGDGGDGGAAGCKPMLVAVNPGSDSNGPIPVNVSTSVRNLGTYSGSTSINITADHTTGNAYTVNFHETRSWISGWNPIYGWVSLGKWGIVAWSPVWQAPRSWTSSIGPCFDFALTPQVDVHGQTTIESGGDALVGSSVTNAGPTKTNNVDWRLTRLIYDPGATLSDAARVARTSNSDPCDTFQSLGRDSCDIVQQDASRVFETGVATYSPEYAYTSASNLPAGSTVCFTVGVSRPSEDPAPSWSHSQLSCMTVSKRPKVQVHGGDAHVGGSIETGLTTIKIGLEQKTYGSWVEYGAFAVGNINGFASGSGIASGSDTLEQSWSRLTFANSDDSGGFSLGHFASAPRTDSLIGQFTAVPSDGAPSSDLGLLEGGVYHTGDLTITDSEIGQDSRGRGKSIIIVSTGTVTIVGNIEYRGPIGGDTFSSFNQIPQVVIVAKDINIGGSVGHIDAWLQTTGTDGTINTCSEVSETAILTINICSNDLKINGALATSHLHLRRTAGADTGNQAGEPAETLNLPGYSYVWSRRWASEVGKAQTVYTKDLPPRY